MYRRTVLSALLLLALLAAPARAGIDQWTRVGPNGANVRTLAAAPSKPSTVYAGLSFGGVFRSLDAGATWAFAGGGLNLHEPVRALVVDAHRPGFLWAGTDNGIYRSANMGLTWFLEKRGRIPALVQDPVSGALYAGQEFTDLMLRSTDGGATWTPIAGSPRGVITLAIDPVQPKILYAGNLTGLFKSTNAGASWARVTGGLPSGQINAVAVAPRSRTVYAVTSNSVSGQIVFRSDDQGQRWTSIDGGDLGPTSSLAVDPGKKETVWTVSGRQLFRSLDRGRTWDEADAGIPVDSTIDTVLPGVATLLAGASTGVYRSANQGISWSFSSQGLEATTISGLALDPLRPLRLYAATPEVYRTASGGGQWTALPNAPQPFYITGPLATDPHRPGFAYLGLYGGVAHTTDAGNTWTSVTSLSCIVPQSIAVDPLDSSVVYAAGTFVSADCGTLPGACSSFRSDDSGQHWTCLPSGGHYLAPDPLQAGRVYALAGFAVEVSTDRGASWSPLTPTGFNFSVLVPDPQRPGTLWAGGADGLFRSDDGGHIWNLVDGGIPENAQVSAVVLDPVDKDVLYAATLLAGVFKSSDGGLTWEPLGTGLAGLNVRYLVLDPRDRNTLYAGTDAGGVMKIRQSGG